MFARAIETGIAALCLAACAHPAAVTTAPSPTFTTHEPVSPSVIKITARQWRFTPEEIHLVSGQAAILEIVSLDVTHGFDVPDLGVRVDVNPGAPVRIPVQPQHVGTYAFHCDVFCGDGHEEMSGRIVVESAP
jgi:cytochrome c oxidase subunit 2